MKTKTLLSLALTALLLLVVSCQKELDPSQTGLLPLEDNNTSYTVINDTIRVASQPNGKMLDDIYANSVGIFGGFDNLPIVIGCQHDPTSNEDVVFRTFLRFSVLDSIPQSATIVGAKLFLTTPSSSVFPNVPGNSSYPGSPDPNNTALIKRVDAAWKESQLNWINKPPVSDDGMVKLWRSDAQFNWTSETDVTDIVKYQIANRKNYGFCITPGVEKPYRMLYFQNSETKQKDLRPKIVIFYKL